MKKLFLFIIFTFVTLPVFAAESDDPAVYYNKGIDLYEQDKTDESIEAFKKAISLDSKFYEAYYNLARVQESVNKTDDAIKTYEKLLEIAPNDYESAYQFGEILYKKGQLTKAGKYLSTIPNNSEYYQKAKVMLSNINKKQSELAEIAAQKASQNLKSSVVGNVPAPSGLVVDSSGNMYVASFSENIILKISKEGTKSAFADKTKGLDGPIGLSIDSYNNIYVANYNKGNVLVFNNKGESKVLMLAKKPYCLSVDEKNNKIYVTEQENNSIISFDISEILASSKTSFSAQHPVSYEQSSTSKVITVPIQDRNPIGTPSIQESNFSRTNPQSRITAPIMIPSSSILEW